MTDFLLDTLAWTGALIALVLVLRRPVARHFGARAAYALWALPALRLVIPPVELPAWMRAAEPVAEAPVALFPASDAGIPASQPLSDAALIAPASSIPEASIDFVTPLLILWLFGAGIFLVRRFALYFAMRRDLLEHARPVGDVGRIRMVETPQAEGPVAFGVFDRVVALPVGLMASRDRAARDLAIAHELAHHRGGDLLVNFLVQPLFALHWFNPLGWAGWKALRRDQEAACDARVIASRPREDRTRYAAIIAGFATTAKAMPRHALAAPMACPVLGDKSIVHRLRSLTMTDISRRRRLAGRALIGAGVLALPLTATISYAAQEVEVDGGPAELEAEARAPTDELAAPLTSLSEPAEPSAANDESVQVIRIDPDGEAVAGEGPQAFRVRRSRDGAVGDQNDPMVIRLRGDEMSAEERAEFEAEMAELREAFGESGEFATALRESLGENSEFAREMKNLRKHFAEDGDFRRELETALSSAHAGIPRMISHCDGSGQTVRETVGKDGKKTMVFCQSAAMETARAAMGTARAAIGQARPAVERDRNLSDKERREALESLDEAMREIGQS
ncbi:M56 family metallopeptidase [Qipengyuania sp. MTN3-11]|uniref:M56 family metallopeptidase n=1 Tax=Qipengyuania sp. MTN3-11 TaxID=3056557 RepID=UPI0036F29DCD